MAFSSESPPGPPSGDLEAVLRRLDVDPAFKASVVRDPRGALAEFDLPVEDLRRLTEHLADEHEVLDPVEQRTSKAGLFALLTGARAQSARSRLTGRRQVIAADVSGFQFDADTDADTDTDTDGDAGPGPGPGVDAGPGPDVGGDRGPGDDIAREAWAADDPEVEPA